MVFGDAVIKSTWDHNRQCITLDADITRSNGGGSTVDGCDMARQKTVEGLTLLSLPTAQA